MADQNVNPVIAAGILAAASAAHAQNQGYAVLDLGTVSGSAVCECFFGHGINESGQAAVRFFGTDHAYATMFHDGAANFHIGSLGGDATFPRAINDHGAIVGFSDTGSEPQRAFQWTQAGGMTDLGTLAGSRGNLHGAIHSDAHDVNNAGQVVGSAQNRDGYSRPFLWTAANGMMDLGTFGGVFGDALGINEAGTVVGWAWDADRDRRPFIWTAAGGMIDLGTLAGGTGGATDVNMHGQVVGASHTGAVIAASSVTHAVLWNAPGSPTDLGVLPGAGTIGMFGPELVNTSAAAINDHGQIVGNSYPATISGGAFLYEDGAMTALTDRLRDADAGWVIHEAGDINNAGQIIATGRFNGGDPRAVILTPIGDCPADLTGDGAADVLDLLDYLSGWFALGAGADRTSDAMVDVFDLLDYLDDWFVGC